MNRNEWINTNEWMNEWVNINDRMNVAEETGDSLFDRKQKACPQKAQAPGSSHRIITSIEVSSVRSWKSSSHLQGTKPHSAVQAALVSLLVMFSFENASRVTPCPRHGAGLDHEMLSKNGSPCSCEHARFPVEGRAPHLALSMPGSPQRRFHI